MPAKLNYLMLIHLLSFLEVPCKKIPLKFLFSWRSFWAFNSNEYVCICSCSFLDTGSHFNIVFHWKKNIFLNKALRRAFMPFGRVWSIYLFFFDKNLLLLEGWAWEGHNFKNMLRTHTKLKFIQELNFPLSFKMKITCTVWNAIVTFFKKKRTRHKIRTPQLKN